MKKVVLVFVLFLCLYTVRSQVLIIGQNKLNNTNLDNTTIVVKDKESGVITYSFNTRKKSEFELDLDFGRVYHVFLQNPKCPVMYFEVIANTVPKDKYDYTMSFALEVPFVNKNDPDIDTTVFKDPFYKIMFDGGNKMRDDEGYNYKFARSIIKKKNKVVEDTSKVVNTTPSTFTGKLYLLPGSGTQISIKNRVIYVLDKNGKILHTVKTNRNGAFVLTQIIPSDIHKLRFETEDSELNSNFVLYTSKGGTVSMCKAAGTACEWNLTSTEVDNLIDNNYTSNIGGKLISSSPKEKRFFASENVYLFNSFNTVIKQTKTNLIGSFVFEDIEPNKTYLVGVDKDRLKPGEKIDMLGKEDNYIATLDSNVAGKNATRLSSTYNKKFNDMSVGDEEMKMDIKATIFGDNVNHPIGKLKVVLLNDNYQVIDSAITDNLGTFKFKYLPFLKRFYLSAENTDNILDVFKNILIYSSENNLIKILTHQKGTKFTYNPVDAELLRLRDVEIEDPWMDLIETKPKDGAQKRMAPAAPQKSIVENILFETNQYNVTPAAKEVLDKIILVLNTNKHLRIQIEAHTDSEGSEASNMKLSEMRAKTVSEYIVRAGIDKKRLSAKGYGESKLLNQCKDNVPCSDLEHAQNRRIEFKILGE